MSRFWWGFKHVSHLFALKKTFWIHQKRCQENISRVVSAQVPIVQWSVVSAHTRWLNVHQFNLTWHWTNILWAHKYFVWMLDLLVACTEAFNLFQAGDIIDVLQMNQNGLWRGRCRDRVGTFKFINVELLPTRRRKRSSSRSLRYVRCFCAGFLLKSIWFCKNIWH